MATLQSIPGIDPSSIELLEAAGFLDQASLAKASVDALLSELERANAVLKISDRLPLRGEVESWISAAALREPVQTRQTTQTAPSLEPVNYELNPEVAEMLASAPFALPLPAKVLMGKKLGVADIPSGILLNRVVGDLEICVADSSQAAFTPSTLPKPRAPREQPETLEQPQEAAPVRIAPTELPPAVEKAAMESRVGTFGRRDIDVTRVKSVADVAVVRAKGPATPSGETEDRVALLRAPRPETNVGKNPESRRYIRGVLHAHPYHLAFAAFVTLCLMVLLPLAIISAALLLASDLKPELLPWVPKWLLAFPLALPVVGGVYLIWGLNAGRCRICNQQLFVPRRVNKNTKAHHVPLIGYIVPTALHLLVFRWFRCTYCGTAVRVKE